MCGIAGIVGLDGRALPPGVAEAMCAQIVHRGPDDQGVLAEPDAQIGMRRLAIIDLAGGHQPIPNEDRTVWVVFNGEIYNFRELRTELEARGHAFATHTDTECIVHAYEEYGDAFVERLRGMFALALLDRRRGRLLLARDRLGKKPLYYMRTASGALAFASELKCFRAVPGFAPRVSAEATRQYVALGYVPAPGTIFEDVHKLPGAHVLAFEGGRVEVRRYWRLAYGPKWTAPREALRSQLRDALEDAVRARLVSDVPFGAFLSGGLDSSVVAALMARSLSQPLKTFTIGFDDEAFDETADARRVASHLGTEHHELVMKPDAVDLVGRLAWHFDEPFADASSIPTFLVSRLAAGSVKMVLSGDGGDEAFAGYERYGRYAKLDRWSRAAGGRAPSMLRAGAALVPGALGVRLARIADRAALPWPDRYLSGVALTTPAEARSLLCPELAALDPYGPVRGLFARDDVEAPMERILAGDVESYLVDDVLVKVDRMTMANSIEARAPLLDHRLLEFCARLPYGLKREGDTGKVLFREVAATLLPPECLAKPKRGFGVPLAAWFRGPLGPMVDDLVASRGFRERGVFDPAGVRAALERHRSGLQDMSEHLWLVLMHECWAREFDARP